jgi:putative membrane protein
MYLRDRIKLYLKGMAMGAADVVPGVSGGTIAFISGIYEELLGSIKAIGPDTLMVLRKQGIAAAWKQVNGNFLLTLVAGIATSILLLVRPITWALKNEPVLLWSFFFGLIAASVWLCGRQVWRWTIGAYIGILVGTVVAVAIGLMGAGTGSDNLLFYFFAGALAICAMILPGISGSFILLLLGAYAPVMDALKSFNIPIIAVFIVGCVAGLMAFSRFLNWMFTRQHDLTVATLSGFLLGSLTIVWPWKEVLSTRIVHAGKPDEALAPFLTGNVWPTEYATVTTNDVLLGITDKEPQVILAVILMLVGAGLLVGLEKLGARRA